MQKDFIGSVIFTQQLRSRSLATVKKAAAGAGIDEKAIRDLNTKFVFIRAMNAIKNVSEVQGDNGALKDKLLDDENICRFQFSRRFVEAQGAFYDKAAVIDWDKRTGEIRCESAALQEVARKFFDEHAALWLPRDIAELIRRVLESKAKRIYLRHGVYFVPYQAADAVEQIEKFLSGLGITFWTLPIGVGGRDVKKIHEAIIADMVKEVLGLQAELESLSQSGTLTERKQKNRKKELLAQVRRYRELAMAVQADMSELARRAGTAGDVLVMADMGKDALLALAQSGKKPVPGMLLDLQDITVGELPAMTLAKARSVRVEAPPDLLPVDGDGEVPSPARKRYAPQEERLFSE